MKFKVLIVFIFLICKNSYAEPNNLETKDFFYIGKMQSYNNDFTLYFKTRNKAVLARGEEFNYITDYPQDLYLYDHTTKQDKPIISYDWFPSQLKKITKSYNYPLFPEDFAYYLLNDNNTLILVSAQKKFYQNLKFNIQNKKLSLVDNKGKLDFIISSFARSCGYSSLKDNFECRLYKPLISRNLISSIE